MFELTTSTEATLKTVTPRTERHGEDDVFAISLGLKLTGANTLLDALDSGARHMLYMAAEAQEQLPGVEPATPLLRCKGVESVKLKSVFEGWTLRIDGSFDEDNPIVIGDAKLDNFVVVPAEGGSIELHFRLGSNDVCAEEAGWLCAHLKQGIFVTLTAPRKAEGPVIDGTVGHPGLAAQGDLLADESSGEGESDEADATDAFVEAHEDA